MANDYHIFSILTLFVLNFFVFKLYQEIAWKIEQDAFTRRPFSTARMMLTATAGHTGTEQDCWINGTAYLNLFTSQISSIPYLLPCGLAFFPTSKMTSLLQNSKVKSNKYRLKRLKEKWVLRNSPYKTIDLVVDL